MHIKAARGPFISTAFGIVVPGQEGDTLPLKLLEEKQDRKGRGTLTLELAVKGFGDSDFQMAPFLLPARFHRHVEVN